MNIQFKGVSSSKIRESFSEALSAYHDLHEYEISLYQKPVKSSTMQAQPVISVKGLLTGIKKYQIKLGVFVSSSDDLRVEDVPPKVLTGWFAHELGHLVDYLSYSTLGMIIYGIKYVTIKSFKIKAEHQADYLAIKKGFRDEIIATKEWVLNHELVDEKYKAKLHKYYLSIEDVRLCNVDDLPFEPVIE